VAPSTSCFSRLEPDSTIPAARVVHRVLRPTAKASKRRFKMLDEWRSAAASRPPSYSGGLLTGFSSTSADAGAHRLRQSTYLSFVNTFRPAGIVESGPRHHAFNRRMIADVLQQAPWERERFLRIMNIYFAAWIRTAELNYWETELGPMTG